MSIVPTQFITHQPHHSPGRDPVGAVSSNPVISSTLARIDGFELNPTGIQRRDLLLRLAECFIALCRFDVILRQFGISHFLIKALYFSFRFQNILLNGVVFTLLFVTELSGSN